ncbi:MAG: hypothetical protein KatS3mg114_0597 [Planctomycetaceae bacterium]|nr:MAG: hypothetical protein KatS3mg114_0597 [Planctomycetaceae bacterium]
MRSMSQWARCFAGIWGLVLPVVGMAEPSIPETIVFNRDVRPILSDRCFLCHGPDRNTRQADLRLDDGSAVQRDQQSGLIVPGHPERSELMRRITTEDETERMPPPSTGKPLTARDLAIIRRWIEQGAEYQGHWAYIPPSRPNVPEVMVSAPRHNPIDHFIQARLEQVGLSPAEEADRVTLIRRLSFDLTGLPPRFEDVQAFLRDIDPQAYEKLVARFLDSPHYGERMAVYWLDLVRYADTIGYHSDNPRNIAPYRDYVIRAFQENMPFDQFTREQLAGDLLPQATLWQRVASGYNRLLQTTEEGGAQPKEYRAKYFADRVRNVSAVWLGATMMCAECHDHKYDPYTMRDFYSLAAFFADIQEADVGRREPGILVPSSAQEARLQQFDAQLTHLRHQLEQSAEALARQPEIAQQRDTQQPTWILPSDMQARVEGTSTLRLLDDSSWLAEGTAAAKENFVIKCTLPAESGSRWTGLHLEVLPHESLPAQGPGRAPNGNFVLTEIKVSAMTSDSARPLKLAHARADHEQDNYPISQAIDGAGNTGWACLPQTGQPHQAVFAFAEPVAAQVVEIRLEFQSSFAQHQFGRFRLRFTTAEQPAHNWLPPSLIALWKRPPQERSHDEHKSLVESLKRYALDLDELRQQIQHVQTEREQYVHAIPRCLVTVAGPRRTIRILPRGNWMDDSGPEVEPAIPAFLGTLSSGNHASQPLTRLDLAHWLTSRNNPLTARVMVNRLWKLFFGTGLSKTVEDLGSQGEWPTHPELLDWLAVEFMDCGWDVKHMIRLIVTSHTYRQSSRLSPQARGIDPYNRLLSAQNRFRVEAEFIRDTALRIAGLLSPRVGGESVFPYQPAGYWDYLNFPRRTYVHDKGEKQYRRGLYTHWQRSFLHPQLLIFDAPSREECVADRPRSSTPQQALALLNDPTFVEAARLFAVRVLTETEGDDAQRITWAYQQAISREPRSEEREILLRLLHKHRRQYQADRKAAEQLLQSAGEAPHPQHLDAAELAAWMSVTRTLLNLYETTHRL